MSITIGSGSTAANTAFTVIDSADVGERFGGVAIAPVPEPETDALFAAGLGALALARRRTKDAPAIGVRARKVTSAHV